MRISLEEQINELKSGINKLLETVNINLHIILEYLNGVETMEIRSTAKTNDLTIRALGNELEKLTVRILSLQAPVGKDLRLVLSTFRIIYDIQRISRDALNAFNDIISTDKNKFDLIRDEIKFISDNIRSGKELLDIFKTLYLTTTGEHQTHHNLIEISIALDNEIDNRYDEIQRSILSKDEIDIETGVLILSANRSIERYGDHACNIIERAIYIQTGERVSIK